MKHFRVKIGYGAMDFLSIDETELPMALRAQVSGKVGIFKSGTISGNHIISITPDWQKIGGYNADYQLGSEDYKEIGSKTVNEYREFLQIAIETNLKTHHLLK